LPALAAGTLDTGTAEEERLQGYPPPPSFLSTLRQT